MEAIADSSADVVFLSTPHEASIELVPELLAANPCLRIVDLSGAYRFGTLETFAHWYKLTPPAADTLSEAVYSPPELYADALPKARLVANSECYPTSVILGLRPLVIAAWISRARGIVCDCNSGASGADNEPKRETHFAEEEIRRNIGHFLVLHKDGDLVGCVALESYGADLAEIRSLAVNLEVRGRRVGATLIEYALEEARRRRIARVVPVTYSPEFFLHQGFENVRRQSIAEKIERDCQKCPKHRSCKMVAVIATVIPERAVLPALSESATPISVT